MKELLLKIRNKTFLIVETPEKIIEITAKNNQAKTETINLRLYHKKNIFYNYPIEHKGLVEFICKGHKITQEIGERMMGYINTDKWLQEKYPAKHDVIERIEAEGYWWEKHNVPFPSPYDPRSKTGRFEHGDELKQAEIDYREAEDKTFNPKRTLIFEIKQS